MSSPFTTTAPSVTMPFGKHKGKAIRDLPIDYLAWLVVNVQITNPALSEAIHARLNGRDDDRNSSPESWDVEAFEFERQQLLKELKQAKAEITLLEGELAAHKQLSGADALRALVRRWYGALSRRFHPDMGGSAEKQAVVNVCYRELMTLLEEVAK